MLLEWQSCSILLQCKDKKGLDSSKLVTHTLKTYHEFMGYLGMVHSITQESDVSSVYVIVDWNAEINANSVFGSELSSFCTEHRYVISDIEH